MHEAHRHDPFDFRMPGSLRMGAGARRQIAGILAERNVRRVALISGPRVAEAGLVDEVVRHLGDVEVSVFAKIGPDPSMEIATVAAEFVRACRAEAVVGLGGGSSLDVAKLAAVMAAHNVAVDELVGTDRAPGRGLPTVLVPTTAGTGSEVSPIAVVSDGAAQLKKGVVSPHLVADAAVVDPELTLTMPPSVTGYTGLDALTHCIEAYTNKHATPFVDGLALEGVRLIGRHLVTAVHDGMNREARHHMALGSLYGGMVLGTVNTAAVHALAYPLGGTFQVAHGVANSLLLPHVMRFNAPAAPARFAAIARAMGERADGLTEAQAAEAAVAAVDRLSAEAGIVRRLRDLDIPESALPEMAAGAMQVTRLLSRNPREVTEPDALAIYQAAY